MVKYCFLDCETGGVDPKKHALLQIAGIIRVRDKAYNIITDEVKERVVKPDFPFSFHIRPFKDDVVEKEALEANGLNPEEGLAPNEAHQELGKILARYVDRYNKRDKFFFLGYNAQFDNQFLREFFAKCGDKYFGSWFFNPPLDVMSLALFKLMDKRAAMENFKLATVAKAMEVEFDIEKAHGAEYDIQKPMEIFDKCCMNPQ